MSLIIITSVILHFATKLGNYYHSLIFKSILKLESFQNSVFNGDFFNGISLHRFYYKLL